MIVLDTSVLSLVFRRRKKGDREPAAAVMLRQMIDDDWPLVLPGIVLQELLSGVRSDKQFRTLRAHLDGFPVLLADQSHHVRAAQIANACRSAGVACSTIDALIAALTVTGSGKLFTTDQDFQAMAPYCGLGLVPIDDAATA